MFGLGGSKLEKLIIKKLDHAAAEWIGNYINENGFPDLSSILSDHRSTLKSSWKEYCDIKRDGIKEALADTFKGTNNNWYSQEDIECDRFFVVPAFAVKSRMLQMVENFYSECVAPFRQLPKNDGSRKIVIFGCAVEAITNEFERIVTRAIRKSREFESYKLIAFQRNDLYHFDSDDEMMSRASTLIFVKKVPKISRPWRYNNPNRPIERNFSEEQYNLWRGKLEFDGGYDAFR